MEVQIVPVIGCSLCHGRGVIVDWVDYGSTQVPLESLCSCVTDQVDDENAVIELVSLDEREWYPIPGSAPVPGRSGTGVWDWGE